MSPKEFVEAALGDLRAAGHLRAKLPRTERQVLKLIDDAAELILKAILGTQGITCTGMPFPELLERCKAIPGIPVGLGALHRIRNRIKHDGASAPNEELAAAYEAIMEFTKILPASTGVRYYYCVTCHGRQAGVGTVEVDMAGKEGRTRKAETGWCFRCDTKTFRIVQPAAPSKSGTSPPSSQNGTRDEEARRAK